MSRITFSREGYEKLRDELAFLMNTRRREIAKDLAHARAFGDLRENAEYDAAKEAHARNEKRILDLTDKLSRAKILDESDVSKDQVFLGVAVTLTDLKTDETFQYKMVSAEEADFRENKIAISSPIGKALLGHRVNEKVTIQVPAGTLEYQIIKIE